LKIRNFSNSPQSEKPLTANNDGIAGLGFDDWYQAERF